MNHEIFKISRFFKSSDFGFRRKKVFFAVPGSRSGSRKLKSCGSTYPDPKKGEFSEYSFILSYYLGV